MRAWHWRAAGLLACVLTLLCSACSSASPTVLHVRLDAGPRAAAFDTPIYVKISGLPPDGLVTLRAKARDYQDHLWESTAEFRATSAGRLDLATAVPVSGDYHVADSNGLLWSLQPTFTRNPVTQFLMNYPGFSVTVQVLANGRVQASQTLRRVGPVPASTQTVRADGFASTMFLPTKLGLRRERGFHGRQPAGQRAGDGTVLGQDDRVHQRPLAPLTRVWPTTDARCGDTADQRPLATQPERPPLAQRLDHDQAGVRCAPDLMRLLQRPEPHACVELPGPRVTRVGVTRTEGLDLQQRATVRDQIGFKRLDQRTANAPPMQGRLNRHQVDLGRSGEVPPSEQHADRLTRIRRVRRGPGSVGRQFAGRLNVVRVRRFNAEPRRQQPEQARYCGRIMLAGRYEPASVSRAHCAGSSQPPGPARGRWGSGQPLAS